MVTDILMDTSTSSNSTKSTKRKIDEALLSLDEVLRSANNNARPQKRLRFPATLYSTLAKYGVRSPRLSSGASGQTKNVLNQHSVIHKHAPHLSAILARAASRKIRSAKLVESVKAAVICPKPSSTVPGAADYKPSSITSFLARLATFKLSTYSNKPTEIDAVAAAKAGWINEGKDRLVCGICEKSWIVASREGLSKETARALVERQRQNLINMHKDGCPWKVRQCDDTIYCIPLQSPSTLAREIKGTALSLDEKDLLEGVEIRHLLSPAQVQELMQALRSVKLEYSSPSDDIWDSELDDAQLDAHMLLEPSEKAAITALFGWRLPSTQNDSVSSTRSRSQFNSTISTRSVAAPVTPRRDSWASSVSEAGSPRASSAVLRSDVSQSSSVSVRSSITQRPESQADCLYCPLCQRRIGLWTFKGESDPAHAATSISASMEVESISTASSRSRRRQSQISKRPLDLLKEHRPYCPYVVRSTIVPSLPAPSSTTSIQPVSSSALSNSATLFATSQSRNASFSPSVSHMAHFPFDNMVEGWRALLNVVLRTGLGRRQRLRPRFSFPASGEEHATQPADSAQGERREPPDVDNIRAMVDDVKSRGGRALLSYVKSLFA